ncbi:uncharacterized protein PV06_10270 [Exophiala oligosperma]|uniref:Alpha/beta hydrolase fold-3 domain-containing protein n=1 Tax=Exophiala oligosperma TaxID=215243 RepID=A0A0D2DP59_9EURO|nr:uncharacterized protein PV06_10270 [Exophiala oligosperma]KIW37629.1 hypothetical protein PV06_10270 [Exophiala oligosperma]
MDASPSALIRLLLPRIPLILKTALLNILSLSENSSRQDARTEITVALIRSITQVRKPMRFLQRVSTRDPGIKGPVLVSKDTIPAPIDHTIRDALDTAIRELGDGSETYTLPEIVAVETEWITYKAGVPANEPRADVTERGHYQTIMENISSPTTILYFHGGAYFLMDPATHRTTTSRLAKLTGGRCYSVRYRLAPQHPFPSQLLDAFIAYLSLLSPPQGMHHEPVSARHIVFAGDSAGGNLAIALMLLLLTLKRKGIQSINFHGAEVSIELPGGVAINSPWVDIGLALPSLQRNAHFDYLDPPSAVGLSKTEPLPDDLWPTSPPRAEIFCNASMMMHPLASPLAAPPKLWEGMPPIFMCLGNESLEDEITLMARKMHQGGGIVDFAGFEGMPHCFAMVFPASPMARDCFERWAKFCSNTTQGERRKSSRACWAKAFSNPPEHEDVELDQISQISDEEAFKFMKKRQEQSMNREQEAVTKWQEQQSRAKL